MDFHFSVLGRLGRLGVKEKFIQFCESRGANFDFLKHFLGFLYDFQMLSCLKKRKVVCNNF